ncbi:uncharacterized protein LOC114469980 isoform X1 [Gouania willdenowi]|uniref:uncharacterized protein LOC114456846 n=1 Tax=Gouania willdenowi TaxID=441366 RepID=UPI00105660A4|nr:uncharacterized protein LOC114456846 [Gouania willdenowi]XP_028313742.1 uncharacterized protein LOC114469980 isoform X1 [Gouania willdenowi]
MDLLFLLLLVGSQEVLAGALSSPWYDYIGRCPGGFNLVMCIPQIPDILSDVTIPLEALANKGYTPWKHGKDYVNYEWYMQVRGADQSWSTHGWSEVLLHTSYTPITWPLTPSTRTVTAAYLSLRKTIVQKQKILLLTVNTTAVPPSCLLMGFGPDVQGTDPIFWVDICITPPATPIVVKPRMDIVLSPEVRQNIRVINAKPMPTEEPDSLLALLSEQNNHVHHRLRANSWYRMVELSARTVTNDSCYVCSHLPHAVKSPTLLSVSLPVPDSKKVLECLQNKSATPCPPVLPVLKTLEPLGQAAKHLNTNDVPCGNYTHCYPLCVRFNGPPTNTKGLPSVDINHCATVQNVRTVVPMFARDGVWLKCGDKVYPSPPINMSAVCVPVAVTDGSFIVHMTMPSRSRREIITFTPHDAIWGSDVPPEHRYWSTSQKVVHALFPNIGVGKNSLMVETLQYRFHMLLNASLAVNNKMNARTAATAQMAIQNRMALDTILASTGGVCAMVGATCCTYIPNNSSESIEDALQTLRNLEGAMSADESNVHSSGWDWLFQGSWFQFLLRLGLPLLAVLLVVGLACCCIVPCVKKGIDNMIIGAMQVQASPEYQLHVMGLSPSAPLMD